MQRVHSVLSLRNCQLSVPVPDSLSMQYIYIVGHAYVRAQASTHNVQLQCRAYVRAQI